MAIRVTPAELYAMANQLKSLAAQSVSLASQISAAIANGTAAWEGAAQQDFTARFDQIKPTLTKDLPELINAMATSASQRAQRYEEADRV